MLRAQVQVPEYHRLPLPRICGLGAENPRQASRIGPSAPQGWGSGAALVNAPVQVCSLGCSQYLQPLEKGLDYALGILGLQAQLVRICLGNAAAAAEVFVIFNISVFAVQDLVVVCDYYHGQGRPRLGSAES